MASILLEIRKSKAKKVRDIFCMPDILRDTGARTAYVIKSAFATRLLYLPSREGSEGHASRIFE